MQTPIQRRTTYHKRKLEGRCVGCGTPGPHQKTCCAQCRAAMVLVGARRRSKLKTTSGTCNTCGASYTGEYLTCNRCRDRTAHYREKNSDVYRSRKKDEYVRHKDQYRRSARKRTLGVTDADLDRFDLTLTCDVCGLEFLDPKMKHCDHNHLTGKYRGALCADCNLGIGRFKDDTSRLQAAISYLERIST